MLLIIKLFKTRVCEEQCESVREFTDEFSSSSRYLWRPNLLRLAKKWSKYPKVCEESVRVFEGMFEYLANKFPSSSTYLYTTNLMKLAKKGSK